MHTIILVIIAQGTHNYIYLVKCKDNLVFDQLVTPVGWLFNFIEFVKCFSRYRQYHNNLPSFLLF